MNGHSFGSGFNKGDIVKYGKNNYSVVEANKGWYKLEGLEYSVRAKQLELVANKTTRTKTKKSSASRPKRGRPASRPVSRVKTAPKRGLPASRVVEEARRNTKVRRTRTKTLTRASSQKSLISQAISKAMAESYNNVKNSNVPNAVSRSVVKNKTATKKNVPLNRKLTNELAKRFQFVKAGLRKTRKNTPKQYEQIKNASSMTTLDSLSSYNTARNSSSSSYKTAKSSSSSYRPASSYEPLLETVVNPQYISNERGANPFKAKELSPSKLQMVPYVPKRSSPKKFDFRNWQIVPYMFKNGPKKPSPKRSSPKKPSPAKYSPPALSPQIRKESRKLVASRMVSNLVGKRAENYKTEAKALADKINETDLYELCRIAKVILFESILDKKSTQVADEEFGNLMELCMRVKEFGEMNIKGADIGYILASDDEIGLKNKGLFLVKLFLKYFKEKNVPYNPSQTGLYFVTGRFNVGYILCTPSCKISFKYPETVPNIKNIGTSYEDYITKYQKVKYYMPHYCKNGLNIDEWPAWKVLKLDGNCIDLDNLVKTMSSYNSSEYFKNPVTGKDFTEEDIKIIGRAVKYNGIPKVSEYVEKYLGIYKK